MISRVIPCLLLRNNGLVKTVKFKDPVYVGDPINAVKIFNEKEVDELIFLDIDAGVNDREPPYELLNNISSECFMPLCYGGGIKNITQISKIINAGVEKISINTYAYLNPSFIKEASDKFGSSTIVVSIDVKKNIFGKYNVYIKNGKENTGMDPVEYAKIIENSGAGEIMLTSIEREGTQAGYDIELIKKITQVVNIPVIANGGAGKIDDFKKAIIDGGASAVSAGSFFVFYGKRKAVLISYPSYKELEQLFKQ